MKKQTQTQTQTNKKLQLDTTKIRVLTPTELDAVVGGAYPTRIACASLLC